MLTPHKDYRRGAEFTLVLFDVRIPGATKRFQRERWAWAEAEDVEMLDEDFAVHVVQLGSARRLSL